MRVEILSEDKSGSVVVKRLTERLLQKMGVEFELYVRPHRGCGSLPKDMDSPPAPLTNSLLGLLPAELRAYNRALTPDKDVLVVIMDSDDKDPNELRDKLYSVCRLYCPSIRTVVGLCTEEIEAWLLGDFEAIIETFPEADVKAHDSYTQDSVCGTWEKLCEVVEPEGFEELLNIGYPAIGNYKAMWADKISMNMDPERNVSPSFILYKNALLQAIKNPQAINKPRVKRTSF